GGGSAAQLHLGVDVLAGEPADLAPRGAETDDVAFLEHTAGDGAPVDPGAVAGEAEVDDVDVGAAAHQFGVERRDAGIVQPDVGALTAPDRGHLGAQPADVPALLDPYVRPVHGCSSRCGAWPMGRCPVRRDKIGRAHV